MLLELIMCVTMQPGRTLQDPGATTGAVRQGAAQQTPDPVELSACRASLLEELARPTCSATSLVERLLELGFPPLAATWPLLWSEGVNGPLAEAFVEARISQLDVLAKLTLASPAASVRRQLGARLAGEPRPEELIWIAEHLAAHGSWREVDLALALGRVDATWLGIEPERIQADVQRALCAMLARDDKSYGTLRSAVERDPRAHGGAALEALGAMAGPRALATLSNLLEVRPLTVVTVLEAVARVARRSLPPFDEFLLRRLRELAADDDPRVRAAGLRACAALAD
ncbi:MAG TPA: hypothetical protein VMT18_04660, partial [Planctomycetota bacterium]|nr:hypothetical protein [Planctomycetota bacterium]